MKLQHRYEDDVMAEPETCGRKHEDIDVVRPFFKIIPNIYLILEQKPSCVIDVWIIKAQLLISI